MLISLSADNMAASFKVGITGGIGSGKSFVSKLFKTMGVPFYDADKEAKKLMNSHPTIRKGLRATFGEAVYDAEGHLNRSWLSEQVFHDASKLEKLNAIVHPIVIQDAVDWSDRQTNPYSLKEAALLYESGSYKTLDYSILVIAPEEIRIQRVMQRDNATRENVIARINKQMSDEEKKKYADFIIINDGVLPLIPQIYSIHQQIVTLHDQ